MGLERDKEKLIGKVITAVKWAQGGESLEVVTTSGALDFYVAADCCSESWIEHVSIPKLPAQIIDVKERDLPTPPDSGRQGCDQAYSAVLLTDQGELEIEFRNSSNGYYGGDIDLASST